LEALVGYQKEKDEYRVVISTCSVGGCPAIMEGGNPDELVVVGKLNADVLNSAAVRKQTGEGEIAVVIPRSLLVKAAKSLNVT
jgi:hypothetical protein